MNRTISVLQGKFTNILKLGTHQDAESWYDFLDRDHTLSGVEKAILLTIKWCVLGGYMSCKGYSTLRRHFEALEQFNESSSLEDLNGYGLMTPVTVGQGVLPVCYNFEDLKSLYSVFIMQEWADLYQVHGESVSMAVNVYDLLMSEITNNLLRNSSSSIVISAHSTFTTEILPQLYIVTLNNHPHIPTYLGKFKV